MFVEFLEDTFYRNSLFALKGEIKELSDNLAFRFIKRHKAKIVEVNAPVQLDLPFEEPTSDKVEPVEVNKMTKKELIALASELGIELPKENIPVAEIREYLSTAMAEEF